jgi:hypothetical protein
MSSPHRPRLLALVDAFGDSLSESERIEVTGCVAAGEERLALEQLAQFLVEREAVVTTPQRDELAALARLYGTTRCLIELPSRE